MGMGRSLGGALVVVILALAFGIQRAVVFGQTSHVVINEVELNPPGDDRYATTIEWVELYNPTQGPVNIGGWKIITTGGSEHITFTIPYGATISAHGFYVAGRGNWLDNNNEMLILMGSGNQEVDRTPVISDTSNDFYAWARYPNGKDTDSALDWRFQASTQGASNGGEEVLKTPSSITCSVNASSIQIGGSVRVSGVIQPPRAGATVSVIFTSPTAVTMVYNTTSQSDATYSHAFAPDQVGSWSVKATWPGDTTYRSAESQSISFTVTKLRATIVLTLSKDRISPGETLTISGSIAPIVSGINVKLEYRSQGSTYLSLTSVATDHTGSFSYVWRETPRQLGNYDLRASWTGDDRYEGAETRVSLAVATLPSSVTVQVDPRRVTFGQTITINGSIVPTHVGASVELVLTKPNGSTTTRSCETMTDGTYQISFVPDRAGSWTVKAGWSGDVDHAGADSGISSFAVEKASTAISIIVSPGSVDEGSAVRISGSISPAISGATISLTLTRPDGSIVSKSTTTSDGGFSDSYTPDGLGSWSVEVSWPGNENYLESISEQSSFAVSRPFPLALAVLAVAVVAVGGYVALKARSKQKRDL